MELGKRMIYDALIHFQTKNGPFPELYKPEYTFFVEKFDDIFKKPKNRKLDVKKDERDIFSYNKNIIIHLDETKGLLYQIMENET